MIFLSLRVIVIFAMFRLLIIFGVLAVTCQGTAVRQSNRQTNGISYFLYTRDNPRDPIQLFATAESAVSIPVLLRAKTAIIVHGHQGSSTTTLNPVVKDAFLTSEDVNVIVVDWSGAASLSYSNAVTAVPNVGLRVAQFIQIMEAYQRISLDRLHLIGFDLGAHVVGFTGRYLQKGVARITGLDPTGSRWGSETTGRLNANDAQYVEVIHTDGDGLSSSGIGTAIGQVDFFANGGGNQPGCLTHSCSHNRAWELFAASLTHDHLIGNLCSSNTQLSLNLCRGYALPMGNNELVKYGSGIFRVNTRRTYPF